MTVNESRVTGAGLDLSWQSLNGLQPTSDTTSASFEALNRQGFTVNRVTRPVAGDRSRRLGRNSEAISSSYAHRRFAGRNHSSITLSEVVSGPPAKLCVAQLIQGNESPVMISGIVGFPRRLLYDETLCTARSAGNLLIDVILTVAATRKSMFTVPKLSSSDVPGNRYPIPLLKLRQQVIGFLRRGLLSWLAGSVGPTLLDCLRGVLAFQWAKLDGLRTGGSKSRSE